MATICPSEDCEPFSLAWRMEWVRCVGICGGFLRRVLDLRFGEGFRWDENGGGMSMFLKKARAVTRWQ